MTSSWKYLCSCVLKWFPFIHWKATFNLARSFCENSPTWWIRYSHITLTYWCFYKIIMIIWSKTKQTNKSRTTCAYCRGAQHKMSSISQSTKCWITKSSWSWAPGPRLLVGRRRAEDAHRDAQAEWQSDDCRPCYPQRDYSRLSEVLLQELKQPIAAVALTLKRERSAALPSILISI